MQGFPPGGNVEFVARLLANEMSKSLGQTIIVESKPGQAGSLAAEMLAAAEPDGHTLLLVSGAHPATAAVYKKLKYDPVDSFAMDLDGELLSIHHLRAQGFASWRPSRICWRPRAAIPAA